MKRIIRLTESDLHRIIERSTRAVLRETNWFGNDRNYGERWYDPFSWKSDEDKRSIDRGRAYDEEQRRKEEEYQEAIRKHNQEVEEYRKNMPEPVMTNGQYTKWLDLIWPFLRTPQGQKVKAYTDNIEYSSEFVTYVRQMYKQGKLTQNAYEGFEAWKDRHA